MKTWIAENQLLAIVLGLLILAGLIWLISYLMNKYGNSESNRNSEGIDNETVDSITETISQRVVTQPTSVNRSPVGLGVVGASAAPSGGMAGVGARVSTGGKTH